MITLEARYFFTMHNFSCSQNQNMISLWLGQKGSGCHLIHDCICHGAESQQGIYDISYKIWFRCALFHYGLSSILYPSCFIMVYHQFFTLHVLGPSYLSLTKSISWLLMPWLLTSPGLQQPWYWLCRIGRFLSYLRKDFNNLRHTNVEKWHKM